VSSESPSTFSVFLGSRLEKRRVEVTREWVQILADQLPVDGEDIFPSEDLLNHIPDILERIAAYVADPEAELLEALVIDDLSRLAELRRRQGFGVQELLREYQILTHLLQKHSEEAAAQYNGPSTLVEVVRAVGRLKDATHLLSAVTARSFELWHGRYAQERQDVLETYGQILSHELGNRLGAAETAVQLLQSDLEIPQDRIDRLLELALESIRRGLETVDDVQVLAQPVDQKSRTASVGLRLLIAESVRLARGNGEPSGVEVSSVATVPAVRVPGPPLRVALSNLLGNALKYHRDAGPNRWIRVASRVDGDTVEVVVEDNGPGIPDEDHERVFHHRFRGNVTEEGSGLGLAITRDAIEAVGGTVVLENGDDGGARFVVRIPVHEDQRD
jgi:signal transduction histidine kinase